MRVYIGCCGFTMSRRRYYTLFDTVELQETFYNPPRSERLRRLRGEAPELFVFNMKAWQAITHPPNLATWRRSRFTIPKDLADRYGFLRPTKENFNAWESVKDAAKAIQARVVIIQLPPSFKFSETNLRNAKEFLDSITPTPFIVGLELRGNWRAHEEEVKEIVGLSNSIVHVVDPFKWRPVLLREVTYFRLHGRNGEVNYRYRYTDSDLAELLSVVKNYSAISSEVYVLFNNVSMRNDGLRFKGLCTSSKQGQ